MSRVLFRIIGLRQIRSLWNLNVRSRGRLRRLRDASFFSYPVDADSLSVNNRARKGTKTFFSLVESRPVPLKKRKSTFAELTQRSSS